MIKIKIKTTVTLGVVTVYQDYLIILWNKAGRIMKFILRMQNISGQIFILLIMLESGDYIMNGDRIYVLLELWRIWYLKVNWGYNIMVSNALNNGHVIRREVMCKVFNIYNVQCRNFKVLKLIL